MQSPSSIVMTTLFVYYIVSPCHRWRHTGTLTKLRLSAWYEILGHAMVAFQHGFGVILMTSGILLENSAMWRWGVVSEMAFEINDSFMCVLKLGRHNKTNPVVQFFLVAHHLLGMVLGIPACLEVSDNRDVQIFGLFLLGKSIQWNVNPSIVSN